MRMAAALLAVLTAAALSACSEPVQAPLPAASMSMGIDSTGGPRLRTHYLSARILDRSGEPVPGVTVSWQQSDPDGEIIVDEAETNHRGVARARWVMTGFPGRYAATATAADGLSATTSDSIAARRYKSMMSSEMVGCVIDFNDRLACWATRQEGAAPLPVSPVLRYQLAATPGDIGASLCALDNEGFAWCTPEDGQWQTKFTRPLELTRLEGLPSPLRDISASIPNRWCGITLDGELWCWGSGLLGDGPAVTNAPPRRIVVDDSLRFTALHLSTHLACAIDTAGVPWCWGRSMQGSLPGARPGTTQETPIPVALPVPIRKLRITALSGICALDIESRLICWGYYQTRATPRSIEPGEVPTYPPAVPRLSDIEAVFSGFLGLGQDGVVYTWGCADWAHGPCTEVPEPAVTVHPSLRASALTRADSPWWYACVRRFGTDEIVCASARDWFRPTGVEWYGRDLTIWSPPPITVQ